MDIENKIKRKYEKNLDAIADELIGIKINEYPYLEADTAWNEISRSKVGVVTVNKWHLLDGLNYPSKELEIYNRFFDDCIEAGRCYQKWVDKKSIGKNALSEYISDGKFRCFPLPFLAGFFFGVYFGTEISMDAYGVFGGGGVGLVTGGITGHYLSKFFGKRKYRKGFLKGLKGFKKKALTDLMKTHHAKKPKTKAV